MHMRIDKEAEMPQKNDLEVTSQEMTIRNKYKNFDIFLI
jgi:hypothetical protein